MTTKQVADIIRMLLGYLKGEIEPPKQETIEEAKAFEQQGYECLEMAIKAFEQQPCEDCISREEAIKSMENIRTLNKYYHPEDNDDETLVSEVIGRLNKMPPVVPKEKTGKWKVQHTNLSHLPSDTIVTCLECGHTKSRIDGEILNFCPKCGARMT